MISKEAFYAKYQGAINGIDDMVTEHAELAEYVLEKCGVLIALVNKLDGDNWESIAEQLTEEIYNIEWRLK